VVWVSRLPPFVAGGGSWLTAGGEWVFFDGGFDGFLDFLEDLEVVEYVVDEVVGEGGVFEFVDVGVRNVLVVVVGGEVTAGVDL